MTHTETVYLNGQFIPKQEAKISILDRGFLLADGVYDCIPVFHGKPLHAQRHLDRLRRNLEQTQITLSLSDDDILSISQDLISHDTPQQSLYIQVTRGASDKREHTYEELTPTVLIMAQTIERTHFNQPIKAILHPDIRWNRCDIKSINRLANVLMSQAAKVRNAEEAIIIDNDHVLEGAKSNVFIYDNNSIITPQLSHDLLGGVTREIVINLCQEHYSIKEDIITVETLMNAEEVWITSSTRGIAPVVQINDQMINHQKIGRCTQTIQTLYQAYIEKL